MLDVTKVEWMPIPEPEPGEEPHVNCFQRTLLAFRERMGLTEGETLRLGSYFGGGMRCGGTCGPVNAGLLVLGWRFGDDPAAAELGREYLEAFAAANGSWLCADIRDEEHSRCDGAIDWAVNWLGSKWNERQESV